MNPHILGVGTAVPTHVVRQTDARTFARGFFQDDIEDLERLLRVFENTGIEKRHLACPVEWYRQPHSFPEKNAIYRREALSLAAAAATTALDEAGLDRSEVGGIVMASTTGLSTPSLDSHLVQLLDLPRSIARVPLWGLGCAAGGGGLARASTLARGLGRPVLLVAVELCSVTFLFDDRSKANVIAVSLFGDGAGAAVLGFEGRGVEILGEHARLFDDTEDVMGWKLHDQGLQVVFSRSIPAIVRDSIPSIVADAAAAAGIQRHALRHFVLHPGGRRVLDAYASSLELDERQLDASRHVLREYGNMSSPSVLFVLERFLQRTQQAHAPGVLLGLGPGFCAEGVTFRW